jgi:hypothetical protein
MDIRAEGMGVIMKQNSAFMSLKRNTVTSKLL